VLTLLLQALPFIGCGSGESDRGHIVVDSAYLEILRSRVGKVGSGDTLVYLVAHYDPERDPFKDLAAAVAQARVKEKRILLVVGGVWCAPCLRLDHFTTENERVREMLIRSFVVVKVNYGPLNHNVEFLSQFPNIVGYPHMFILDSDGALLHSQTTEGFEEVGSYDERVFVAFLNQWMTDREPGSR
jgi:hypothetical protein